MEDYVSRLLQEQSQLVERHQKLKEFTKSDTYKGLSEVQRELMITQLKHMKKYIKVLNKRIKLME